METRLFSGEIALHTETYGVNIQFWPTLKWYQPCIWPHCFDRLDFDFGLKLYESCSVYVPLLRLGVRVSKGKAAGGDGDVCLVVFGLCILYRVL
jgi:hypothetical protein